VCPWRSGRRPARVASSYSMRTEGFGRITDQFVMRRISVFAAATADEALARARTATSLIDIIIANLDLTGEDDGSQ